MTSGVTSGAAGVPPPASGETSVPAATLPSAGGACPGTFTTPGSRTGPETAGAGSSSTSTP
ncbi:hypothetical protein [Streptomyces sp. NPDC085479]|uniref:hypothetical protein n=1 Tax=Streptomyces sp. NPDC085479 TaxID=3365726 RepID=UPI0037D7C396